MDLSSVESLMRQDTKALVLVNPNNPTGSFVQRNERDALNALCRAHQTAIISDEVFADFILEQKGERVSLVDNEQVLTFVLGGISKTLGLPQMKLSWIVANGPTDLVQKACARLEVIADTYLSVNTPVQNALPVWMARRPTIQKEINERLQGNYSFLKTQVKQVPECQCLSAQGGWYAVVKIPATCSEEQWSLGLLEQDHVLVHPGYFFDFDSGMHLIMSLLPATEEFRQGVVRIVQRIINGGF